MCEGKASYIMNICFVAYITIIQIERSFLLWICWLCVTATGRSFTKM